jgi:hypothetical protein
MVKEGEEKLQRRNTTEYTECQAFSPVVRIGSPSRRLTRTRVLPPPPFGSKGGGTHSLAGRVKEKEEGKDSGVRGESSSERGRIQVVREVEIQW